MSETAVSLSPSVLPSACVCACTRSIATSSTRARSVQLSVCCASIARASRPRSVRVCRCSRRRSAYLSACVVAVDRFHASPSSVHAPAVARSAACRWSQAAACGSSNRPREGRCAAESRSGSVGACRATASVMTASSSGCRARCRRISPLWSSSRTSWRSIIACSAPARAVTAARLAKSRCSAVQRRTQRSVTAGSRAPPATGGGTRCSSSGSHASRSARHAASAVSSPPSAARRPASSRRRMAERTQSTASSVRAVRVAASDGGDRSMRSIHAPVASVPGRAHSLSTSRASSASAHVAETVCGLAARRSSAASTPLVCSTSASSAAMAGSTPRAVRVSRTGGWPSVASSGSILAQTRRSSSLYPSPVRRSCAAAVMSTPPSESSAAGLASKALASAATRSTASACCPS
eukprot:Unigene14604_Nuclearia_a/m.43964 Unigene14604_Nuclearia_a/g.43964  ORF Unigene14604_Nuclearia_a/g.43964 Unigene14604_Nuclearia_a/m.43964 type:complete len:409 (-) Unigene14604_Nuclearia_a:356-1582(-)